ncbi:methyltransferase domain-containing protein [Nocardia sp. NPDC050710]|uniref:methyltransferase domain-containing protein n=1 Tax=Nocardia sp. NPDC050710 TaxID=3157220 RepID=UPI0033CE1E29
MQVLSSPGLGELLRYVGELIDRGAEEVYASLGMSYRPRYTPVLRAMSDGASTVTDITNRTHVTQSAISQTVGLMVADELLEREQLHDGRMSGLRLTDKGRGLVEQLEPHWEVTFAAVVDLEREIGFPIRRVLADTASVLERTGFADRIRAARQHKEQPTVLPAQGGTQGKNWFDRGGLAYARFRPEYPDRLAMFLAALAPAADLAVDVGCGTGQLTAQLAPYFRATIGLDPSAEQIEHAQPQQGVRYVRAPAEKLAVPDRSAALITAAQAVHWFDRPAFYSEVRRIAVESAVLALISYGVVQLEPDLADRFDRFYRDEIGPYWPPERKLVDSGYTDLDFPFEEYPAPPMRITKDWNLNEVLGYLSTWSAVRRVDDAGKPEVLHAFAEELTDLWGDPMKPRQVSWPVNMRIGIV